MGSTEPPKGAGSYSGVDPIATAGALQVGVAPP